MPPFVLNITGLKKSGKTTVAEALIAAFKARGYSVGSVKSMVMSSFTFDTKGKDTYRHSAAGAEAVIALSKGETVHIERNPEGRRRELPQIIGMFREDLDIVVCEGVEGPEAGHRQILCLREPSDIEEALKVRGLRKDLVIAVSGLAASWKDKVPGLPTFDVMISAQREKLADLVLEAAGAPPPTGRKGGPLLNDPDWTPGVLPPGEYPEVESLHH